MHSAYWWRYTWVTTHQYSQLQYSNITNCTEFCVVFAEVLTSLRTTVLALLFTNHYLLCLWFLISVSLRSWIPACIHKVCCLAYWFYVLMFFLLNFSTNWMVDFRILLIFTVRRSALHGLCDSNSVCLSVCLSVALVDCVHTVRPTIMISSPYGSPIILVSRDIKFIPKFEGGHPERGRWMRVGWVRIGDFRPISRRISETVRDMTKVTINH